MSGAKKPRRSSRPAPEAKSVEALDYLPQVILFAVDGAECEAEVVGRRPAEEDPEHGLTHKLRYTIGRAGVEWVTLKESKLVLFRAGQKGIPYNIKVNPRGIGMLDQAVDNHVESFNALIESGLDEIVKALPKCVVEHPEGEVPKITVTLESLIWHNPANLKDIEGQGTMGRSWYPADCRLAHTTYSGKLEGKFVLNIGDQARFTEGMVDMGTLPVMVRSKKCALHGKSPKQLIKAGEDETESGGYFLVHGLERCIRMLIMPRANYPMAVSRGSYENRGHLYTQHAVVMRCMRPDGSTMTNSLHYCKDGSCFLRFSHSREEWLIPLVQAAHCCHPISDRLLVELMTGSCEGETNPGGKPGPNHDLVESMMIMLQQQSAKKQLFGQSDAQAHLGSKFRVVMGNDVHRSATDKEVGSHIVKRFFLVHTDSGWQKLQTLCVMYQKLMGLVRGDVEPDNQDAFSAHEVLPSGQLYGIVLREALEVLMLRLGMVVRKMTHKYQDQAKALHQPEDLENPAMLQKMVGQASDVQKRMENFLATGNLTSRSGSDLMQTSGYTIVADKLNQFRWSSHFASVHRGQYFAEMKTTTVRKLLPETWGFLCPVHTPDGSPCGLLNHLANSARAVVRRPTPGAAEAVAAVLASIGAELWDPTGSACAAPSQGPSSKRLWVLLDGCPLGHIESARLVAAERALRKHKVAGDCGIPDSMEIVSIGRHWGKLFPGLFLFLAPGRLTRPVRSLETQQVEWIGPLEQLFMSISALRSEKEAADLVLGKKKKEKGAAALEDEVPEQLPVDFTHEELQPTQMFSLLAGLTPFSNHNQSPRNMYQCQMLKQTMGTPYHNHEKRTDNKIFRILNPQKPIVRTEMYNSSKCDLHPPGTNAVVAVITYTGYDMEDAMIINKMSYERGFGHGVIYKTKILSAAEKNDATEVQAKNRFSNLGPALGGEKPKRFSESLDDNGMPAIGTYLTKGTDMYCVVDHTNHGKVKKYEDDEACYVEAVALVDGSKIEGGQSCQRALLRLRYPRNPIVGDKFSSRHGQKGVMSFLWPQEDMPFTEGGVTPDILFNPHGFPSRMTIGMLIESIAAKAASADGKPAADGTTFREYYGHFNEGDNEFDPFCRQKPRDESEKPSEPQAAEYFGKTLVKHGFQKLGTERMYSGIHGTEMETDIFMGVVYYQRLRHLVSDKAQVRNRGTNDQLLGQPVKGRKRGGGIRFGEMERDSLLAHGCSFLLHDRLMRCSDYDVAYVCPSCHSILTPQANADHEIYTGRDGDPWTCPPCTKKLRRVVRCHQMPIPIVFRYLVCEMASMNIKMQIRVSDRARQASLSSGPASTSALHDQGR